MRVPAAVSTAVRPVLAGPVQPAQWVGAGPSALYLLIDSGLVLAVLAHDAVRLPGAIVLSSVAAERPLVGLVGGDEWRASGPASVGAGRIEWNGPVGTVTVVDVRAWAPSRVRPGRAQPAAVAALRAALAGHDVGLEPSRVDDLAQAGSAVQQYAAAAELLGRGPGLTPSGDDVLAGFLLAAQAFGHPAPGIVAAVNERASRATTALSAQLLRDAGRGECVPEFAAAVDALCGRPAPADALARLLAVGHTSGTALALGLLSAVTPAGRPHAVGAMR
jgi:hypothetical protein